MLSPRWAKSVDAYIACQRAEHELSEAYLDRNRRYLLAFPKVCKRAGAPVPASPRHVAAAHIRAIKLSGFWGPRTLKTLLTVLRGFLRWSRNPLAAPQVLTWRLPMEAPDCRHWIGREELTRLFRRSEGRLRVRVILQGFHGLRECEVRRMRFRDIDLATAHPTLTIRGKGRFGGRFRTIPVDPLTRHVLAEWSDGRSGDELVYPVGHSMADYELAQLGENAGTSVRVTGHVLRRSFGRLAYQAGVPLPTIQRIYGHSSLDETVRYVGVDQDEMRKGFDTFDAHMRLTGLVVKSQ